MKLKKEFLEQKIFVPQLRKTYIGKFIPENVLPLLYAKHKDFFEVEEVKTKTKVKNDIPIDNTIFGSNNHTSEDSKYTD